ncbi:hypothetical protein AR687_16760 [Flavobacteriaceae bacterium CRH]|nr:hypothetical protein AR687_16760 [Flavobacteriaceae bacterium CRH]
MKVIKIYCKKCGSELTSELTEIPESLLSWEDNQNMIQPNKFCLYDTESDKKSLVVAIDNYNLKNHSDKSRFNGCCGSSGLDGLNKLCLNGHEVATEFSDCWTSHYIEFDISKVVIREI